MSNNPQQGFRCSLDFSQCSLPPSYKTFPCIFLAFSNVHLVSPSHPSSRFCLDLESEYSFCLPFLFTTLAIVLLCASVAIMLLVHNLCSILLFARLHCFVFVVVIVVVEFILVEPCSFCRSRFVCPLLCLGSPMFFAFQVWCAHADPDFIDQRPWQIQSQTSKKSPSLPHSLRLV